jgi:hypothetical protein
MFQGSLRISRARAGLQTLAPAVVALALHASPHAAHAQAAGKAAEAAAPSFCAVEIGSRGVKGRLFAFPGGSNADRRGVDIAYTKDINTDLMGSVQGGRFSAQGIEAAVTAAAGMMNEMRAANAACKPFVVGSSGIAVVANKDELAQAVVAKTGVQQFEYVTVGQEAMFGFMGTVPRKDWETTLFIDIGSGNTKLAALKGKELFTIEIPQGVTTLSRRAAELGGDVFGAVARAIDSEIRPAFKSSIAGKPIVMSRSNVVMIGGTVWGMSTFLHPDKVRRKIVRFGDEEFGRFRTMLENRSWSEVKTGVFSSKMTQETFMRDSKAVMEIFTRDNLVAGTSLLKMVLDERSAKGPVYFARQGNWLYGYVQDRFAAELWGSGGIEEHM